METIKKILIFFNDNIKQIRTTILGLINILVILGIAISPIIQEKTNEILTILVSIDAALLTIFLGDAKK
jgi:hypothetical protein